MGFQEPRYIETATGGPHYRGSFGYCQPPSSSYHPAASFDPQAASHNQLAASFNPPAASFNRPATLYNHPAASVNHPAASIDHPAASIDHPAASINHPAASFNPPAASLPPPAASESSRKRKADDGEAQSGQNDSAVPVVDLTSDCPPKKVKTEDAPNSNHPSGDDQPDKKDGKGEKPKEEEKRLRRFRKKAPVSYLEVRERALTQRMFVLDRQRHNDKPDHPTETILLAGTTGNVYTVSIDKLPWCDCPHATRGNQCKHLAYVLSRVLRAPPHLEYQLAFIASELREIFTGAPPLPSEAAEADGSSSGGIRKPLEGECPICCDDFEIGSAEEIVYCKAACGNNIHKRCFEKWAATKKGGFVPCPFCRTPWQGDEDLLQQILLGSGNMTQEGYVNVAGQLGISNRRQYTSYNSYWLQNRIRDGYIH